MSDHYTICFHFSSAILGFVVCSFLVWSVELKGVGLLEISVPQNGSRLKSKWRRTKIVLLQIFKDTTRQATIELRFHPRLRSALAKKNKNKREKSPIKHSRILGLCSSDEKAKQLLTVVNKPVHLNAAQTRK